MKPQVRFSLLGNNPRGADNGRVTLFLDDDQHERLAPYMALAMLRCATDSWIAAGRKRVRVWVRSHDAAVVHNICPVVWAGMRSQVDGGGPGFGAVCIGWVPLQMLVETVEAHARMSF